jgi:curved DNA-binding protein CbpA
MKTSRTYYEILGLPRDATLLQIKRRYKQLVRKYHPDVAEDKVMAHRLFIQIQEAYDTLTDPITRRDYDNKLNSQIPKSTGVSTKHETGSSKTSESWQVGDVPGHIRDAQFAFVQRRFSEAITHCKQALKLDPRNARAHAIMGDAYRAQGKTGNAVRSYSYALQYNPKDRESEKKLMNLITGHVKTTSRTASRQFPQTRLATLTMMWWAVAVFLIIMIGVWPGQPIPWLKENVPQVGLWSWNFVIFVAAGSIVIGILISINGLVRHPDQELVFDTSSGWLAIPTGLFLLLGSGFFFLGAAVFYLVASLIQWNISKSVLITFVCVLGVVLLSSLTYREDAMKQVLLFGGNISFLSMLIGWYIGSSFRPLSG